MPDGQFRSNSTYLVNAEIGNTGTGTTAAVTAFGHVDYFRARRGLGAIRRSKLTLRQSQQHLFEIGPPSKIEHDKLNVLTEGSFIRSWSTFETPSLFRDHFFRGKLLSRDEGLGGGNLYVGLNTGSFPVGFGDGIDGACEGHANHKMVVNAVT